MRSTPISLFIPIIELAIRWKLRARSPDGSSVVRSSELPECAWEVVLGWSIVHASLEQLVSLLSDDSKRQKYNSLFLKASLIGFRYDVMFNGSDLLATHQHIQTKRLHYRGVWPVTNRAFHVLSSAQVRGV